MRIAAAFPVSSKNFHGKMTLIYYWTILHGGIDYSIFQVGYLDYSVFLAIVRNLLEREKFFIKDC